MDSLFFTIVLDHTFYLSERINLQRWSITLPPKRDQAIENTLRLDTQQ
jgi:hypothetical protein